MASTRSRLSRTPAQQDSLFAAGLHTHAADNQAAAAPVRAAAVFGDREYQTRGVGRVVSGLRAGGRGQMHAACGTGKTKMAQWSAQQLVPHGGVVVIVAPTVGLVSQTLEAWHEGDEDYVGLAVCSDPSVNDDSFARVADFLEPTTTDPDVVDAWLRRPATTGIRLIVGTHVSAHIIGEGLQKAGVIADLLVIDEAHRSSGWIGKKTALIHDDEVLPAARRLYMTATPRVWNKTRDDVQTYSMDDERVFGPVLFRYPFSDAISDGYLDDYRVAVIGVTRAEVLAVLRGSAARHGARGLPGEHIAMVQAAIARAAAELGLRRVIAFCNRVEDSHRFAATFQHTLRALPDPLRPTRPLHADYVHGGMVQSRRREVLATLTEPPNNGWTVISNAKCLSEGIDVPAVDGVAFTAPKKSFVEIVQAVGRALRRDIHGSGTATIIIPILLPDAHPGDDDEIDAGDFEVLWQIVRGLRAHDDTFSTALDACRANKFRTNSVMDRIEFHLPENYNTPAFVEHLTIRLVKSATSQWWDGYAQLVDFHTREGHTRVNHEFVTDDGYRLGDWVTAARNMHTTNRLAPDRVEALRKLDFVFDARQADWDRSFAVAAAYHAEHGDLQPHHTYRAGGITLLNWLNRQRALKRRGRLHPERETRLNTIGMSWDTGADLSAKLEEVRAYHSERRRLPHRHGSVISRALSSLRAARRGGELTAEVIVELDAMGMIWTAPPKLDWWDGYQHLQAFHAREGHARVRQSYVTSDDFMLGIWVNAARRDARAGILTAEQTAALDKLDFIVDPGEADWEHAFEMAAAYAGEHGNLTPKSDYRAEGVRLLSWLRSQQHARQKGALPADRAARLEGIGLQWLAGTTWQDQLPPLRAYHATHGRLPERPSFSPVSGPLSAVRAAHKRGELPPDAVAELDALGIVWDPPPVDWWDCYAHLAAFQARTGHTLVPAEVIADADLDLYAWVRSMRQQYKQGRLTADRRGALDRIRFVTDAHNAAWEAAFAAAEAYYAANGQLRPPPGYRRDGINLATWLTNQRKDRNAGRLAAERVARLAGIGMEWQLVVDLDSRVAAVQAFYAEHGRIPTNSELPNVTNLLSKMRKARRADELDQRYIDIFDSMGIDWNPTARAGIAPKIPWEVGFAHLSDFHTRTGHTRVPGTFVCKEDGFALGTWASGIRVAYRDVRLSEAQIAQLDTVGFNPDARQALWEHQFSVAEKFYRAYGHLEPPQGYRSEEVSLGPWLSQHRIARRNGTLDPDREARLTAIGMEWQHKYTFAERLVQIRRYYDSHGRLPTTKSHPPLGAALAKMRAAHKAGDLEPDIVAALDAMGINWDRRKELDEYVAETWERGVAAATRFQACHGHLDVRPSDPRDPLDSDLDLSTWMKDRRSDRHRGRLSADQIAELDAVGMLWDVHQTVWENNFALAAAFYAEHGHLRVPMTLRINNHRGEKISLVNWVDTQRSKHDKLTDDQVARLSAIGMDWDPIATRWDNFITTLRAFHAKHGHINVPVDLTTEIGVNVAHALANYRKQHRRGTLARERLQILDELGVDWQPGASGVWGRMTKALQEFYDVHGDIFVPADYLSSNGVNVSDWLYQQRAKYAAGKLTAEQIAILDGYGMVWESRNAWSRVISNLRRLRAEHGHINVSSREGEGTLFNRFLYGQLVQLSGQHAAGTLDRAKFTALTALGIDWSRYTSADPTSAGAAPPRPATGNDNSWVKGIRELQTYVTTVGPAIAMKASYCAPSGFRLGNWLARQRAIVATGAMPVQRVQQLIDLGVRLV